MMHGESWLEPETIQALGWTLLHFVWQGAALTLLLYIVTAFCRSAQSRYLAALGTLILMTACPVATFTFLQHRGDALGAPAIKQVVEGVQALAGSQGVFSSPVTATRTASVDWLGWWVAAWFAGVLAFGARALGGCILIERLRREKIEPLSESIRSRCLALQQRLSLQRRVQYFQSQLVDSPAVIGWFRPVVLLPVTALTGLSAQQLEAVVLHELAHIKRLDSFVNLFQIAAETVLFYHPAIWWVSHRIRTEREHCCDDVAVSLCGNAKDYARALALLESWRAMPMLAMAATGGSLKARIARLIGFENLSTGVPRAGLAAVGLLCAAGVLLAGSGFRPAFFDTPDAVLTAPEPPVAPVAPPEPSGPSAPEAPAPPAHATIAQDAPPPQPEAPLAPDAPSGGSYIGDLHAAGLTNLTVDQLIALKVQGVTAQYVRRMHDAGLHPDADELIAMKVQGISPEYVREIRAAGLNPTLDQLIALKVQGVTSGYVRALRSAGLTNLSTDEYIGAKVQGITPEFIQKARSYGLTNLTLDKLYALKHAGVF